MITGLVTLVAGSLPVSALFYSIDNSQVQSTHFSEFKIIHTAKKKVISGRRYSRALAF